MRIVRLQQEHDFEEWRAVARALLLGVAQPDEVRWEVAGEGGDFFAPTEQVQPVNYRAVGLVPQRFVDLAKIALFHRDPRRFALLYRVLFRLQKHRALLELRSDPDVSRLYKLVSDLREQAERKRNLPASPAIAPPKEIVTDRGPSDEAKAEIISLADASAAVQGCRRCPLYEHAT